VNSGCADPSTVLHCSTLFSLPQACVAALRDEGAAYENLRVHRAMLHLQDDAARQKAPSARWGVQPATPRQAEARSSRPLRSAAGSRRRRRQFGRTVHRRERQCSKAVVAVRPHLYCGCPVFLTVKVAALLAERGSACTCAGSRALTDILLLLRCRCGQLPLACSRLPGLYLVATCASPLVSLVMSMPRGKPPAITLCYFADTRDAGC